MTGGKQGNATITVGLDWLTVTSAEFNRGILLAFVRDFYRGRGHEVEGAPVRGSFYSEGVRLSTGARVLWGHSTGRTCCVDLSGAALAILTPDDRAELLRGLLLRGCTATRVDVAIDVRGWGVDLIEAATDSCDRGEMCGARVFDVYASKSSGGVRGRGLYVGKRGREGSGRLSVWYDKGLETGTAAAGKWTRLEVRFAKECAAEAAGLIGGNEGWEDAAMAVALGAHDYRSVVSGETALARRPRCAWWAEFIGACETHRVRATRRTPDLDSRAKWLRESVMPGLRAMAEAVDADWREVLDVLAGKVEVSDASRASVVVPQFVMFWREYRGGSE